MPLPSSSRSSNPCVLCLSHKACSVIIGILHMLIMISVIMEAGGNDYNDAGVTTFLVLIGLSTVIFCVLLLIGLLKGNKVFVMAYLIFFALFLVMMVAGWLYLLFSPYVSVGAGRLIYSFLGICVYVFFFTVVYMYYSSTYFRAHN